MSIDPLSRLTLRQIRLVAAIAKHGQLSIAASELGITQPAASRTLAEAEKLYGTTLYDRHSRGMIATRAGEILGRRAANVLRELRSGESEIRQIGEGLAGTVVVGAVTGAALGDVVPMLGAFRREAPDVEVEIATGMSGELIANLLADRHDLVLARLPTHLDARLFDAVPVGLEEVRFLCRSGHPLVTADAPASLADIAAHDFVMQARGAPIRTAVEDALRAVGAKLPRYVTVTQSLLTTIGLLERTDAVSPVSSEVADLLIGKIGTRGLVTVPIRETLAVPPYSIVCLRGRDLSPAVRRFKSMLTEQIAARHA